MAALACLLWAWMSTVANGNLDSQFDMLENYAWSQSFRWGTHKHPPLFAWVVGAWFAVFPQTDWAYRLLSYTNVWVAQHGWATLAYAADCAAKAPQSRSHPPPSRRLRSGETRPRRTATGALVSYPGGMLAP